MKKIIVLIAMFPAVVFAQNSWDNSPFNWNNSQYNYDNSSYNYKNSQYNWDNNQFNTNSKNGVYDNNGNRVGYETRSDQGTRNIFDNNGNRIGYGR
jgi:uncharacterized protein YxeA